MGYIAFMTFPENHDRSRSRYIHHQVLDQEPEAIAIAATRPVPPEHHRRHLDLGNALFLGFKAAALTLAVACLAEGIEISLVMFIDPNNLHHVYDKLPQVIELSKGCIALAGGLGFGISLLEDTIGIPPSDRMCG